MDEVSLNTEPLGDDDTDGFEIEGDHSMTDYDGQSGLIQGENPLPPVVGMEFESYEDVYYFYNCYAKEQGFGVRVSNTWYRKSKERYRGKLSCSSAGFKKKSEANRPRPETRTGCPAMIKFRLIENKRWRIIEVELEHNHLISPESGKFYKSHKLIGPGTKRTLQLDGPEDVQKIRMYRTVIVDSEGNGNAANLLPPNQLNLKAGDAQAIQNFFCDSQLRDPNFFYVVDLNEKGFMRNLFWIESRSRVSYSYFNDVVVIDTTCLKGKFEVPLVTFIGVNHHGQHILLGCGLLSGESTESYVWLLRAWLTCMLGRPPPAVITDHCSNLQAAIADVFPRASHVVHLSRIMQGFPENVVGLFGSQAIKAELSRLTYSFLKAEEFEAAWEQTVQHHGIGDQKWIQNLYEDRKRWAPTYVKETFLAGLFQVQQNQISPSIFEGYLNKNTLLREFLDKYELALQRNHHLEALADIESKNSSFMVKPRCYFELQLSKLYTNDIMRKFEKEVEGMYGCLNIRQVNIEGPLITYLVKEQVEVENNQQEIIEFEVTYNTGEMDVICDCGLFNLRGYLCRHGLRVLSENGLEEIPPQYVVARWRKDVRRSYTVDHSSRGIDTSNPVHRFDHLYKCVVRIVEEGRKSEDRVKVTVEGLDEILNKLHLLEN